jgi:hypothetical protein
LNEFLSLFCIFQTVQLLCEHVLRSLSFGSSVFGFPRVALSNFIRIPHCTFRGSGFALKHLFLATHQVFIQSVLGSNFSLPLLHLSCRMLDGGFLCLLLDFPL